VKLPCLYGVPVPVPVLVVMVLGRGMTVRVEMMVCGLAEVW